MPRKTKPTGFQKFLQETGLLDEIKKELGELGQEAIRRTAQSLRGSPLSLYDLRGLNPRFEIPGQRRAEDIRLGQCPSPLQLGEQGIFDRKKCHQRATRAVSRDTTLYDLWKEIL